MAGLLMKLGPGERLIVNGALLENGDRAARIRVIGDDARVLRMRDAIQPHEADTPVKLVYYAIQLLITGDGNEAVLLPAIHSECVKLEGVFNVLSPDMIPAVRELLDAGKYYSALCFLRQALVLEAELLRRSARQTGWDASTEAA